MGKNERFKDRSRKVVNEAKRICIVRNTHYNVLIPNRRNAETLAANGYDVDVVYLKRKGEKEEIIKGVRQYRLPLEHRRKGFIRYAFEYSAFFFMAFWTLSWLSIRKKYHVVEVSGIPSFLVFTAIVPKLLGSKVIFHLLDHTPETFMEHFSVGPDHIVVRILRWLEKTSARWADRCIVTQIINKQILGRYGVPESKISVVLNVPGNTIFDNPPTFHNDNSVFRLITHGSLLERYGVQTLIKAVPLLLPEIPHLKVNLIGDGEYRPQLEQLVRSLGITEYVHFTGTVPQGDIPRYIAEANIGIVTILTKTNPMLPSKLFEYMAVGKPIVSTSIPAITAYFDDSTMMFYEPDDEQGLARRILELYREPEKRTALAAAGKASYQKLRWDNMKNEYLKVFNELTS